MSASLAIVAQAPLVAKEQVNIVLRSVVALSYLTSSKWMVYPPIIPTHCLLYSFVGRKVNRVRRTYYET